MTLDLDNPFLFDQVLGREAICNLTKEKDRLLRGIELKRNQVIYGERDETLR